MSDFGPFPVAVIGLGGVFAGAETVAAYWAAILAGRDCLGEVASPLLGDQWREYDGQLRQDTAYCHRGGCLPPVPFDPLEFGLPPVTLESLSLPQLLALVVARDTLADAGYWGAGARSLNRERAGCILGAGRRTASPLVSPHDRLALPVYGQVLRAAGLPAVAVEPLLERLRRLYPEWRETTLAGTLGGLVAGRIANHFDLHGPNFVVEAACASSLAAVSMAVSELRAGTCETVLTGGVNVDVDPATLVVWSQAQALSRSGQCRPFDRHADGTLLGDGVGMLLLKRLADAERDHDRIYAVIRGLGAASDGAGANIQVPQVDGQVRAIRRAWVAAGPGSEGVGLIEAHGTATVVGDRCELDSLRQCFPAGNLSPRSVAVGSVKSQIGHARVASGAAGLIKAILAVHQKVLPPTSNVEEPQPALLDPASPLYVNTEARPWFGGGRPRRAGVNSFGFGGINYHGIVQEYQPERADHESLAPRPEVVLLTAEAPAALAALCSELSTRFAAPDGERAFREHLNAQDQQPFRPVGPRLGLAAADRAQAVLGLRAAGQGILANPDQAWEVLSAGCYRPSGLVPAGKVAALFPGQGAQRRNMGRGLALRHWCVQSAFEAAAAAVGAAAADFTAVAFPPPLVGADEARGQADALQRPESAQLAVCAFSVGLARLLHAVGFCPDFAVGHSFGELVALWAAGVLGEADVFRLAWARGQAMSAAIAAQPQPTGMLAIRRSAEQAAGLLAAFPELTVANLNSPGQTVLAGPAVVVERLRESLARTGETSVRLAVAAAFHTPAMALAAEAFGEALSAATFAPPRLPVVSTVTGAAYPAEPEACRALLREQILRPVQFAMAVEALANHGVTVFVECGPGRVLSHLVTEILGERPHLAVALNPRPGEAEEALALCRAFAALQVAGLGLGPLLPRVRPLPPVARSGRLPAILHGTHFHSPLTSQRRAEGLEGPPIPEVVAAMAAPGQRASASPLPPTSPDPAADATVPRDWSHAEFLASQERYLDLIEAYAARQEQILAQPQSEQTRQAQRRLDVAVARLQQEQESRLALQVRRLSRSRTGGPEAAAPASQGLQLSPASVTSVPLCPVGPAVPAMPAGAAAPVASASPAERLLAVISRETGYPRDLLELPMNIATDLGVDSLKRVDIQVAIENAFPEADRLRLADLLGARTLGDLATGIEQVLAMASAVTTEPAAAARTTAPPAAGATPPTAVGIGRYLVQPCRLAGPASGHPRLAGPVWLVGDDGSGLALELARRLEAQTLRPVFVQFPGCSPRRDSRFPTVRLDAPTPAAIERQLEAGIAGHGAVGGLIYLTAGAPANDAVAALDVPGLAQLKMLLLLAGRLESRLRVASRCGRAAFLTVSRLDGRLGLAPEGWRGLAGAGLSGLVKALAREWPEVFCRTVDLAPALADDVAATLLLAELGDPEPQVRETGWDGARQRWTVERVALPDLPPPTRIARHGVTLVTGGARGIAAACVAALAPLAPGSLALLGRTRIDGPEPAWARGAESEAELSARLQADLESTGEAVVPVEFRRRMRRVLAAREIRRQLATLEAAGARVRYYAVDVTVASAVEATVRRMAREQGPITGLIHAAGNLADKWVQDKTAADFDLVMGPKVAGLAALLAALPAAQLELLVLFSSLAGYEGEAGQTDYALANEILSRFAVSFARQHPNCRTVALGWGPWAGGMVTPELERHFQARQIAVLPLAVGAARFAAELAAPCGPAYLLICGAHGLAGQAPSADDPRLAPGAAGAAPTPADLDVPVTSEPPRAVPPPTRSRGSDTGGVLWDESRLALISDGTLRAGFGPEYADIDAFPHRCRLPLPPFRFVSRVTRVDGQPGALEPAELAWEYDIPAGAWYLDGGLSPLWIIREAGQAVLLLLSYLGVDRQFGAQGRYRLMRFSLQQVGELPHAGDTLQGRCRIRSFVRSPDRLLIHAEHHCRVGGRDLLTCDVLSAIVPAVALAGPPEATPVPRPAASPAGRTGFVPPRVLARQAFDEAELARLQAGDLAACFGNSDAAAPAALLGSPQALLLQRIALVDPTGGPWGYGELVGECDLPADHWVFAAHFPGDPVLPGSLLFDGALQVLRFHLLYLGLYRPEWRLASAPGGPATECRFLGQVLPVGCRLQFRLSVKELVVEPRPRALATVTVYADGRPVMWADGLQVCAVESVTTHREAAVGRLVPSGHALVPGLAWLGDPAAVDFSTGGIVRALATPDQACIVVRHGERLGLAFSGALQPGPPGPGALSCAGIVPPLTASQFGEPEFRQTYGLRAAYQAGAMARGIASEEMVIALGRAGYLGTFGAAGLPLGRIEQAVRRIQDALPAGPYALSLIHSPHHPQREADVVELYLRRGVRAVEASAFIEPALPLVLYRIAGLESDGGRARILNHVMVKISRPEVAQRFLEPPPAELVRQLLEAGRIPAVQAALAATVPLVDDLTVEGDSGGHTDGGTLLCLLPVIRRLRDECQSRFGYCQHIRVGAAGGIGTPEAVLAAFAAGAAYVVTGSLNQACVEAGTSQAVKELLRQATAADTSMAPAADMFELGAEVQVLRRGTLYPMRARKLAEIYREYGSVEEIPAAKVRELERTLFRRSLAEVWEETVAYWQREDPVGFERAAASPRNRLALICRWYLGQSPSWAVSGDPDRIADYQIWCGPAMGAFNAWVSGTPLEPLAGRRVAEVARHLLEAAARLHRAQALAAAGIALPAELVRYPFPAAEPESCA